MEVAVLRPTAPIPRQGLEERLFRDVFKEGEDTDHLAARGFVVRYGRDGEAAVAHDHRRDAVAGQGVELFIPPHGAIEVGVAFNKTGADIAAGGVHHRLIGGGRQPRRHFGNYAVVHADVGREASCTCTVDDGTVSNQCFAHRVTTSCIFIGLGGSRPSDYRGNVERAEAESNYF